MMRHVESLFRQSKLKSTVSFGPGQCTAGVFWKLDTVSGLNLFLSFLHWSLKNTANGKEACWGDQVRAGMFDCDLRQTFPSPTTILFFSKIRIQFFHQPHSQFNKSKKLEGLNQHPSPWALKRYKNFLIFFFEIKRFKAAKWALAFEILVHTVRYGLKIDQSQDKIRLSHIINKVIWNFLNTQKNACFSLKCSEKCTETIYVAHRSNVLIACLNNLRILWFSASSPQKVWSLEVPLP